MEIWKRTQKEGGRVLRDLQANGITFEITPANTLRITAQTTIKQFELIRLWKAQIVEAISPKCEHCESAMKLIENGKLWFCPLGCESKKAQ